MKYILIKNTLFAKVGTKVSFVGTKNPTGNIKTEYYPDDYVIYYPVDMDKDAVIRNLISEGWVKKVKPKISKRQQILNNSLNRLNCLVPDVILEYVARDIVEKLDELDNG